MKTYCLYVLCDSFSEVCSTSIESGRVLTASQCMKVKSKASFQTIQGLRLRVSVSQSVFQFLRVSKLYLSIWKSQYLRVLHRISISVYLWNRWEIFQLIFKYSAHFKLALVWYLFCSSSSQLFSSPRGFSQSKQGRMRLCGRQVKLQVLNESGLLNHILQYSLCFVCCFCCYRKTLSLSFLCCRGKLLTWKNILNKGWKIHSPIKSDVINIKVLELELDNKMSLFWTFSPTVMERTCGHSKNFPLGSGGISRHDVSWCSWANTTTVVAWSKSEKSLLWKVL